MKRQHGCCVDLLRQVFYENTQSRKYAHLWWNGNWSKRKSVVEKTACSSARTAFAKNVHWDWHHIYALRNGGPWFIPGLCSILNNCGNWRDCPEWINPLRWLAVQRAVCRYEEERIWYNVDKVTKLQPALASHFPVPHELSAARLQSRPTLYQILSFSYPSSQQPSIMGLRVNSFQTIPQGLEGTLASLWAIQNCMQDEEDWTGEDCSMSPF